MIRAVDIFAGIGGFHKALQLACSELDTKYEVVYACEIVKQACEVYEANFGINPIGDITETDISSIPAHDILMGGFPCQGFSRAGLKQGLEDSRSELFYYLAEILQEKRPGCFLFENVRDLETHDRGNTFRIIMEILELDLDYTVYYKVINAKLFTPQNRPRIYMVGFSNKLLFPTDFGLSGVMRPEPKLNTILQDRESVEDTYFISRKYLKGLKKHRARHMVMGHGHGFKVLKRDGISGALVVGGSGRERNLIKDPPGPEGENTEGLRTLTMREMARLQGFPEDFKIARYKTNGFKQFGNSVPVPVVKMILKEIIKVL